MKLILTLLFILGTFFSTANAQEVTGETFDFLSGHLQQASMRPAEFASNVSHEGTATITYDGVYWFAGRTISLTVGTPYMYELIVKGFRPPYSKQGYFGFTREEIQLDKAAVLALHVSSRDLNGIYRRSHANERNITRNQTSITGFGNLFIQLRNQVNTLRAQVNRMQINLATNNAKINTLQYRLRQLENAQDGATGS